MVERLTIDHVGHRGDGISLTTGDAVYVPYTLGGETVEVDHVVGHHPDRRKLLAVEVASPERIAPFCPHFGVCGGCAIQHWAEEPYHAWKRGIVVETLAQAGIDCEVAPLVDAHGAGRRRITLHGRFGTHNVLKVGFSATSLARCHSNRSLPDPRSRARGRARSRLGDRRTADLEDAGDQAARHPGHRDRQRARRRRAWLRPAADAAGHRAVAGRRAAPPGAADAAR